MVLRTSLGFRMPQVAEMEIFEWVYIYLRQLTHRKIGGICRLGFFLLLFFGVYLASSYVASSSGNEHIMEENNTMIDSIHNFDLEKSFAAQQKPDIPNEIVTLQSGIKFGEVVANCGVPQPCRTNEFAVHIYTGKDHKDEPRLCVDGKYILSKGVNGGGRGINVVVVDNVTKTVIRVSHFDTYEEESTALETLLLTLRPGDIILLLTFDEPTRKMSRVARLLLYELGSALVQNLNYRGSWYLVTQKGLIGFSPYEALHSVEGNGWPKHHDVHLCVPFQIRGEAIHPDPLPRINQNRVEFCKRFGYYPLFCDSDAVNDLLMPASIIKRPLQVKQIYNTPILVMSGESITYLPTALETLIRQPGINPSLVVVFYLPHNIEVTGICDLFGFMSVELSQVFNHCERVDEAFETGNLLFPDAKEMLFLSENVILSPDFLYFMGQCLPLLQLDNSILAISAFNENGFRDLSSNNSLLYRVETFTGLAFLVRRNFFQKAWCSNETENDPLFISNKIKGDVIVPDVSRILVTKPKNYDDYNISLWSNLHSRERRVSYEDNTILKDVGKMQDIEYQAHLDSLLQSATTIQYSYLHCSKENSNVFSTSHLRNINSTDHVFAIYVYQTTSDDYLTFKSVSHCFSLFCSSLSLPHGYYKGVLRFMLNSNHMFIVGSSSPFYKHKPSHVRPLTIDFIT